MSVVVILGRHCLFEFEEPPVEILNAWGLAFVSYRETLGTQVASLLRDASRQFRIHRPVVFNNTPVRSDSLFTIRAILFGSFRGDAHKDARRERTSDVSPKIAGELSSQLANSDELSFGHHADHRIDELRRGNQHGAAAEARHLRRNLNDLHVLWLVDFLAPRRAADEFLLHDLIKSFL